MIMTENSMKEEKLPCYKIKEDPTGLRNYDSHNLNLLGFENDVPMLTLQESKSAAKVNKEANNEQIKKAIKSWNGKKLIIKGDGMVSSKLLVVKYKNGKVEIPGRSCNVSRVESKPGGGSEPSSILNNLLNDSSKAKTIEKLNCQVYNVQNKNSNPVTSESSTNVASDHNYFTARRKSSEPKSLVEAVAALTGEVKKNRSSSISGPNSNDSKKIVDKTSVDYKVVSRNQTDIRKDLLVPKGKQLEGLKILQIIKPQMTTPPPLEVIRPFANKVYHNKKFAPSKVDSCTQTIGNITTSSTGVNTDDFLLTDLIESKVAERSLDMDTELDKYLLSNNLFNSIDDIPNPTFLNMQQSDKLMDIPFTNGNFHAVSATDWKKQLFVDLKKCDIPDISGNRPLHLAVMQNSDKLVKRNCIALKARDIDINFTNNENLTALQLALIHNADLMVVETLLHNNCDTQVSDTEGNNIIHLAVLYSNEDVVRLLVTTPDLCDLNACNFEGYTPLILCVINKRYVMADLLLVYSADPNIGDKKSGRTALFHAVEANDAEMVKLLINQKALTKVKNYFGTSPHDAMFELDSIDATIRKLVLNRDDVSSARPKIARGKRKRNGANAGGDRQKIYKSQ